MGHLLRLRAAFQVITVSSPQGESFVSFLCCLMQRQNLEMHIVSFTIVFDCKSFNIRICESGFSHGHGSRAGTLRSMMPLFIHKKIDNLSLRTIGRRINTPSVFFYFGRSGAGWKREQASHVIIDFLTARDSIIAYSMIVPIVDTLIFVHQMTPFANPDFLSRRLSHF
jgi:hypothetical protein